MSDNIRSVALVLRRRAGELYSALLPVKLAADAWTLDGDDTALPSIADMKTAIMAFEALELPPLRIHEELVEIKSDLTEPSASLASVSWADVTDKPETFAPADHSHPAQPVAWADVTNKPETFAPADHAHASKVSKVTYVGNGAATRVISFDGAFLPSMFSITGASGATWNRWEGNGISDVNTLTFTVSTGYNASGTTYSVLIWG